MLSPPTLSIQDERDERARDERDEMREPWREMRERACAAHYALYRLACSLQLSHCSVCCPLIGQAGRSWTLIGPLGQSRSPRRRVWRTTQCQVQGHAGGPGGSSYWPLTGGRKSKNAFFLCKNKICNLAQFQCGQSTKLLLTG